MSDKQIDHPAVVPFEVFQAVEMEVAELRAENERLAERLGESNGKLIVAEVRAEIDRLQEQLEAAMWIYQQITENCEDSELPHWLLMILEAARRDHPELFQTGGGE